MSRTMIRNPRKLANYRLMQSQLRLLDESSKKLGKSKTAIVEEAIANYLNKLHIEGVI